MGEKLTPDERLTADLLDRAADKIRELTHALDTMAAEVARLEREVVEARRDRAQIRATDTHTTEEAR